MFPDAGSGTKQLQPIYPQTTEPIPLHLCPTGEANTKYQLAREFGRAGDCYCEVSLGGRDQIDLVWIDTESDAQSRRIVGIEIKTVAEFDRATHELESQVEQYRSLTVSDLTNATAVAGESITPADETYVFDEVWVVAVGDRDRWEIPWRDGTPEDGWLNYDPTTGQLAYEIDATSRDTTIEFDFEQRVGEAQLTASLWDRYQSSAESVVAAESRFSKPRDRVIQENRLKHRIGKGQSGKMKHADLVVSKTSEITPLREDSTIRGLEVKASFGARTRDRLDDQLPLYCDAGLFSEVYLVVRDDDRQEAMSFLEANHPRVGLLAVENHDVSLERQATSLELQKVPVGRCPGSDPEFRL
ncbi:hypothetical protein [Halomicrobium salinisoli]|uniref:hypothetical protein n=1 Tax=Halomicrobium salinisoli TaxID=2878391 RepID=UPI001CF09C1F|nr:hypothetical protein [Halomicrobium salinisoli]